MRWLIVGIVVAGLLLIFRDVPLVHAINSFLFAIINLLSAIGNLMSRVMP